MQTRVALTFIGEDGQRREVAVDARRFTIGCSADNDLVINAPGIARRHAVIDSFDDGVYLSDCQTPQGTLLNNTPLTQVAVLHSGDLITFGGTHDFTVRLGALDHAPTSNAPTLSNPGGPPDTRQTRRPTPRASSPLILLSPAAPAPTSRPQARQRLALLAGLTAGVLILLVGGSLLYMNRRSPPSGATRDAFEGVSEEVAVPSDNITATPLAGDDHLTGSSGGGGDATTTPLVAGEELEREAGRIVQHIGGDDQAYIFPSSDAVRDVHAQVEAYRGSAGLRDALATMQPAIRTIATQARGEGVQPELVIYAALAASSDGGQNPVALARQLIPQLRDLRATFGSSDANSSLLILAAHTYGVGSKKSHPLLATMRRLVKNSFTERNIWHLREQGGLSDAAYRSVVRTIAVGVIAQDPRRYGVEAAPLVY